MAQSDGGTGGERKPKRPHGDSASPGRRGSDPRTPTYPVPCGAADAVARWFEEIDLSAAYASQGTNAEREQVVLTMLSKAREGIVDLERMASQQLEESRAAIDESKQLAQRFTLLEQSQQRASQQLDATNDSIRQTQQKSVRLIQVEVNR